MNTITFHRNKIKRKLNDFRENENKGFCDTKMMRGREFQKLQKMVIFLGRKFKLVATVSIGHNHVTFVTNV